MHIHFTGTGTTRPTTSSGTRPTTSSGTRSSGASTTRFSQNSQAPHAGTWVHARNRNNTSDNGKLSPSVLIGAPYSQMDSERSLAFDVGKRLAYFRPERFVTYALQTLPRIQGALRAALVATGMDDKLEDRDAEVGIRVHDHWIRGDVRADGTFRLRAVPDGEWRVEAHFGEGEGRREAATTAGAGGEVTLDLRGP